MQQLQSDVCFPKQAASLVDAWLGWLWQQAVLADEFSFLEQHAPQLTGSGSKSAKAVIGAITWRAAVVDSSTKSVMPNCSGLATWVKRNGLAPKADRVPGFYDPSKAAVRL